MDTSSLRYLPAIVCAEYDSPIDALLGRHVVHDEAMDRVTAAWQDGTVSCVVVTAGQARAPGLCRRVDERAVRMK